MVRVALELTIMSRSYITLKNIKQSIALFSALIPSLNSVIMAISVLLHIHMTILK